MAIFPVLKLDTCRILAIQTQALTCNGAIIDRLTLLFRACDTDGSAALSVDELTALVQLVDALTPVGDEADLGLVSIVQKYQKYSTSVHRS